MVKIYVQLRNGSYTAAFTMQGKTMAEANANARTVAARDYPGYKITSVSKTYSA